MFTKLMTFFVLFSFNSMAGVNVIHGPYHLKGVGGVSIEFIRNIDESITLQKNTGDSVEVIDTYTVGDGSPEVETVFFYPVKNKNNVIVLVAWDERNISAVHYKVYAYHYDYKADFSNNADITNNKVLEGYDGYSGGGMTFNYKNSTEIKKYLDSE